MRDPTNVTGVVEGQRRLVDHVEALLAAGELDVSAPSSLPDWTVGHVITHITNSGDGQLRMLEAAAVGEVGTQYPGGFEQRNSDIERGAVRPVTEQVDDLRRLCEAFEVRLLSMPTWDGHGQAMFGEVAIADVPFLRTREVEVHHVDLGVGYGFGDLPPAYMEEETRQMERLWISRQPTVPTTLPPEALAVDPGDRLAWLLGRGSIAGLDPAGIF